MHVLVVEDDPGLRRILDMNLRSRGYRVSLAASGSAALDHIAADPPDLMTLDLGLPDLDGLSVLARIHQRLPDLPILVLSARDTAGDKTAALDLGATDYLTKPFAITDLIDHIILASADRSV